MRFHFVFTMDPLLQTFDRSKWQFVLNNYEKALKLKADKLKPDKERDLINLDSWYQNELSVSIQSRSPMYINYEEICKLMKWKLTRGKFRPRLTELVHSNKRDEVIEASTKAFQTLPNMTHAIKALVVLKAVGPATASAVLAAGAPQYAAFMADESMHALPGLHPVKYDVPFYMRYMAKVKKISKELNKDDPDKTWTPHSVELTLWTYQIIKTMDPDLFESICKYLSTEENDKDEAEPDPKKVKR